MNSEIGVLVHCLTTSEGLGERKYVFGLHLLHSVLCTKVLDCLREGIDKTKQKQTSGFGNSEIYIKIYII